MKYASAAVQSLIELGRPSEFGGFKKSEDYASRGITAADIPELILLLDDEDHAAAGSDSPKIYAQVHAWRALGQLRAETAIEALLGLLCDLLDDVEHDDWVAEEVPAVLGQIGPAALPGLAEMLLQTRIPVYGISYVARAMAEIANKHPDAKPAVIRDLTEKLGHAAENDPGVNGWLIGHLIDLQGADAWPAIEAAFASGNVDEMCVGDADDVKFELGLGPKPPPRPNRWLQKFGLPARPPQQTPVAANPKAKADARKKKRLADKAKKRNRR